MVFVLFNVHPLLAPLVAPSISAGAKRGPVSAAEAPSLASALLTVLKVRIKVITPNLSSFHCVSVTSSRSLWIGSLGPPPFSWSPSSVSRSHLEFLSPPRPSPSSHHLSRLTFPELRPPGSTLYAVLAALTGASSQNPADRLSPLLSITFSCSMVCYSQNASRCRLSGTWHRPFPSLESVPLVPLTGTLDRGRMLRQLYSDCLHTAFPLHVPGACISRLCQNRTLKQFPLACPLPPTPSPCLYLLCP